MSNSNSRRILYLLLFLSVSVVLFRTTLVQLAALAWSDERYTYIASIPFVTVALAWLKRVTILTHARYSPLVGLPLLVSSMLIYGFAARFSSGANPSVFLSLLVFAIVLFWTAGFILFFGWQSYCAALFPLSFLVWLTPMPAPVMHMLEVGLQKASAEVSDVLFELTAMPVFRQGLTFSLPGVDVEVSEECSGIRSSTAFWVTSAVSSYLFLRSGWSRLCLILLSVPIVILKNAVRITTISWLGVNVSRDFLVGDLHRRGGLPFTLIAIALMVPLLIALHRTEEWARRRPVEE